MKSGIPAQARGGASYQTRTREQAPRPAFAAFELFYRLSDLDAQRWTHSIDPDFESYSLTRQGVVRVKNHNVLKDFQHHQAQCLAALMVRFELIPHGNFRGQVCSIHVKHRLLVPKSERFIGLQHERTRLTRAQAVESALESRAQLPVTKKETQWESGVGLLHELAFLVPQLVAKMHDGVGADLVGRGHRTATSVTGAGVRSRQVLEIPLRVLRGAPPKTHGDPVLARSPPAPHPPRRRCCCWLVGALFASVGGCRAEATSSPSELTTQAVPAATTRAPRGARTRVRFETSAFQAGTLPGRFPRVPEREPALSDAKLGPFEIDRYPYPGDPAKPPDFSQDLEAAGRRCSERGGRLCNELEWERACKGPKSQPFATGEHWSCRDPMSCESTEGVVAMGAFEEWTASLFGPSTSLAGQPVIKGANASAAVHEHRCARRLPAERSEKSRAHAFRCCYGAPNGATVVEATQGIPYEFATVDAATLKKALSEHPRTEAIASDIKFFKEPDATETVIARGPGDRKGFDFTVRPLLWRPVRGAEFIVITARSGAHSFVAVFHHLPDNGLTLASSFIMLEESGPVALAYSASIKPRLHFSTCWGCLGETGKILFREPDTAVVVQP